MPKIFKSTNEKILKGKSSKVREIENRFRRPSIGIIGARENE